MTRSCLNCGKEFRTYPSVIKLGEKYGKFCSKKCARSGKFNARYNGGLEEIKKICQNCKKEFIVIIRNLRHGRPANYCSKKCVWEAHRLWTGDKSPTWKGGIRHHSSGYIQIYKPEHPYASVRGEVAEHRLIMEAHLGRILIPKKEIVHHMNHIKTDNRIENLMVMSLQEHSRLHNKGKILSKETKMKMSLSRIGKKYKRK